MIIRYLSTKRNRWYERRKDYFDSCSDCGNKKTKTPSKRCKPCEEIRRRVPIEIRFLKFVKKTESCWIWTGAKAHGYGQIYDPRVRRPEKAYRISWEIKNGKIPENFEILHNCPGGDNIACVNPDHLKIGTHSENMFDAQQKGQMQKGENRFNAVLNEENVRIIRGLYQECPGLSKAKIAKVFKVSQGTIQCIVEGKTWKHVE